jgi:hypothetical protein
MSLKVHHETTSRELSRGSVWITNAAAYEESLCGPPKPVPGPPCKPSLYSLRK